MKDSCEDVTFALDNCFDDVAVSGCGGVIFAVDNGFCLNRETVKKGRWSGRRRCSR
jgi:hypothetical protein